jgi:molybdate transport system ATP-binding protein
MGASHGLDARVVVRRDGFDLDVLVTAPAGVTTALVGPNGAGKSTVIDALAGLVPLVGGHVRLGDRLLADPVAGIDVPPADRSIGVVFQDGLLFGHLSVLDNVGFGPRSRGVPRTSADATAREWLDRLGASTLASRLPGELSGGQTQRVALARALAAHPDLLLLDEPLASVDVTGRAALRRTIADHLEGFDGPRILVTHDPTEAFLLADLVHVIEDGRLTQVGRPAEIRLHPRTRYAADLAGINLLEGTATGGLVDVDGHDVHIADTAVTGQVLLAIHPTAIALHEQHPAGSPRNTWSTTIARVEDLGERVRVLLAEPLPLTVEVTRGAVDALGLEPGRPVWPAIKATEIRVTPNEPG